MPVSSERIANLRGKYKTVVVVGCVSASCFFGAVIYQAANARKSELKRAEASAENVSLIVSSQVSGIFRAFDTMMIGLAEDLEDGYQKKDWGTPKAKFLISNHLKQFPEFDVIQVYDRVGELLNSSSDIASRDANIFSRLQVKIDGEAAVQLVISKPFLFKKTDQWALALSRPIYARGTTQGYLVAIVPLNAFAKLYDHLNLGQSGNLSIFSRDDYTLLFRYPNLPHQLGKSFANSKLHQSILSNPKGAGVASSVSALDGLARLHSYRVLDKLNMIIVIGIGEDEYLGDWLLKTVSTLITVLTALGFFLLYFKRYVHAQIEVDESRLRLIRTSKMSALGEMASGIAHEINNPLAIINGHVSVLESFLEEDGSMTQEKLHRLKKIEVTTQRIAKIVSGLRTFSRSGEEDPFAPAAVEDIVADTVGMCQSRLQKAGIDLRVAALGQAGSIDCRAVQISQILLNLIHNATDAVEAQRSRWIEISVESTEQFVKISVIDSGSGIPSDVAEKMMHPFFTTKPVGKGSGLGLSITKGLVESHGGSIELRRESPHTHFVVTLPRVPPASRARVLAAS